MNKRDAKIMALELSSQSLRADVGMGMSYNNTFPEEDGEKVQKEIEKIINSLEDRCKRLRFNGILYPIGRIE